MGDRAPQRPHYAPGVPASIEEPSSTLDGLLAEAARDYPHRIAVDFLGRTITYAELDHQTRKAAGALHRAGVRAGDVVALVMPNCPQHIVAFYACLTLGATVAEHNPLAPASELREQLDRHGARVAIVWEQSLERLTADGGVHARTYLSVDLSRELPHVSRLLLRLPVRSAREQRGRLRGRVPHGVLSFDRAVRKAPALGREELPGGPSLDDLAVLIHTGGTTGVPKAVALTHRNLASNAAQTLAWVPIVKRGAEVEAGVLPFFHAFGLTTVLVLGVSIAATIVLLPRFDVAALLAAHRRRPITLVPGVPPMFERILEAAESHAKPVDLTSICFAFSGAMALEEAVASRWEEATGGYIIEGYGMTEASPIIAGSPLSPERRPSTLGLPLPSTEIRLADPEDPSRDAEDVGEILVRGPQVFSGYYGMPEETAEVLADGWLRTGDLGRWDEGFLVMADRRKELIINGGFNVYPSQVEEAFMGMPGVRDVAVVGMPEDRGESVVAALVLEPGAIVDLDAVRRWTQDKLSHYAMPRSIAVMDELPRSQLGKVMRRSVREQLAGFELLAGQWRRKASELGETTSENLKSVIGKSTSAVSGAVRSSSDAVRHGAEVVTGAARHGAEVVSEAARQGAGAVSEAARNATEAIAGAARNAGGAIQGRLTSTGESLVSAMKRGERTPSAGDGRAEGPPALPEAPGEPDAPDVSTDRDAAEGEDADGSVRDGRPPGSPRP